MVKDLSPSDLRSILEFSITIALKAGAVILQGSEAIQSVSDIGEKTNSVDLVTEFDVKVEELLKAEIGREYPDFKLWVVILRVHAQDEGPPPALERNHSLQARV
jgi:myo-inositol-1(or 4)-monophosphatase